MAAKIALVTGGSRGLGKDSALRLAEHGNDVILTYKTKREEAEAVAASIEAMGRKVAVLQMDVGEIASFDAFFARVRGALKETFQAERFDFLINNAGIGATIPFADATTEQFDLFLNVHFKGVFFLTQKALAMMNDDGAVVNFSSGTTRYCFPGYSIYASMKGAIEVFTKYLAKEAGGRRIRANVIAPGAIETDFNNASLRNNPQRKELIASQTALGRVGQAEDIGGIVAFLCSDEGRWINGQRIEASGGVNL